MWSWLSPVRPLASFAGWPKNIKGSRAISFRGAFLKSIPPTVKVSLSQPTRGRNGLAVNRQPQIWSIPSSPSRRSLAPWPLWTRPSLGAIWLHGEATRCGARAQAVRRARRAVTLGAAAPTATAAEETARRGKFAVPAVRGPLAFPLPLTFLPSILQLV